MKKLALAFSSKDRVDLTARTFPRALDAGVDVFVDTFWIDGSTSEEGRAQYKMCGSCRAHLPMPEAEPIKLLLFDYTTTKFYLNVEGGPDRAIVFALSQMLSESSYTHVGLLENDVLLDSGWLEPTLKLFDNSEGLPVGAVSARSFEDRVLIQRDGYAVMHNVGAGHVIFTREAAQMILDNYRTGWWPENRAVFSQLSGIDIGKFAAFHHNEQMTTADWSWDTILAAHGLATVALTPSKATMIGQDLTLKQQGLKLVDTAGVAACLNPEAFKRFSANLNAIRQGIFAVQSCDYLLRTRGGILLFPHHADKHGGSFKGQWTTRWNQACGPFTYVAGKDSSFSIPIFGPCAFHVGDGAIKLTDEVTGYSTDVDLTGQPEAVTLSVPRDMQTGTIRLGFSEGACLVAIETQYPQPRLTDVTFDYSTLPEVG